MATKEASQVQTGDIVDYTATATIANGDIIPLVERVGVALDDAVSGDVISLKLVGVFEIGALEAEAFVFGAKVWFDATARTVTTTASTHQLAGFAVSAKGSATVGTILVKIG